MLPHESTEKTKHGLKTVGYISAKQNYGLKGISKNCSRERNCLYE
jgi:hypothetical protein